MTDITNLFRATVKTVKARHKIQGLNHGPDKSILSHHRQKSLFAQQSKEVVQGITKLKEFLLEHRKVYINATSLLDREPTRMTDAERDQIDSDAEKIMRTCSEAIRLLKTQSATEKVLPQVKEHRDMVFALMDSYLKSVCQIYSVQRAIRVKRVVDKKRISRLEPEKKFSALQSDIETRKAPDGDKEDRGERAAVTSLEEESDEDALSPEEAQMFAQENQQLYEEMNSIVDEVKQIEGKVVEISRLQEVFAEKVLEQETDIDRIADTVVGTTENIKEANEEIRQAMKNNAGLRVWILFFLIVLSITLLFLDWYNP